FPHRLIQRPTMPLVSSSTGRLNSMGFFPTGTKLSPSLALSISCLRIHRDFQFAGCPNATAWAPGFVRRALRDEFVFELAHEALHRPGAGFAKGANGPAAGDIVGDLDEVIGILPATLAVGKPIEHFGHPEGSFAAGGALAAAFVGVELADVGQGLD